MLVDEGAVTVGGTVCTSRSVKLAEGDEVVIEAGSAVADVALAGDPSVPVNVVYEDDDVIVVDKPADLVVHPGAGNDTGTLVQGLLARYPEIAGVGQPDRPGIVHRLDRGTSGLLVVARIAGGLRRPRRGAVDARGGAASTRRWCGATRRPRAAWSTPRSAGRPASPPAWRCRTDGREARTRYDVDATFDEPVARGAARPAGSRPAAPTRSGCTSQAIGHPVVGDARYGGAARGRSRCGGRSCTPRAWRSPTR